VVFHFWQHELSDDLSSQEISLSRGLM
jgi:hypothetical protein